VKTIRIAVACAFLLVSSLASAQLKDGFYWAESRSSYTSEPYWGNAFVEVRDGAVFDLRFYIIDKQAKEVFDQNYEERFKGNVVYVEQSRRDWAGLQAYIARFNAKKKLEDVDAISGATWSFNIFKDTLKEALKKAQVAK
jgi:major membrane immunogen (membrane-anchored lipoprotein)